MHRLLSAEVESAAAATVKQRAPMSASNVITVSRYTYLCVYFLLIR